MGRNEAVQEEQHRPVVVDAFDHVPLAVLVLQDSVPRELYVLPVFDVHQVALQIAVVVENALEESVKPLNDLQIALLERFVELQEVCVIRYVLVVSVRILNVGQVEHDPQIFGLLRISQLDFRGVEGLAVRGEVGLLHGFGLALAVLLGHHLEQKHVWNMIGQTEELGDDSRAT